MTGAVAAADAQNHAAGATTAASDPDATDVPDEFGLGERLALVSWLRDHGAPPADPENLAALRQAYQRLAHPGMAPVAAPRAVAADTSSYRRRYLIASLNKQGVTPDPSLSDDQLQALLTSLQDEQRAADQQADQKERAAKDHALADPAAAAVAPAAGSPTSTGTVRPAAASAPTPSAAPIHPADTALARARAAGANGVHNLDSPNMDDDAPEPPAKVLTLTTYPAAVGKLAAYVTPDPGDGVRHPAIIWLTGGEPDESREEWRHLETAVFGTEMHTRVVGKDCNSLHDVWTEMPDDNDQTAAAFRKAGVVMMYPALRGGNNGPGQREECFGEVDDVLCAADDLAARAWVDPARIYLGGQGMGATLALLTAESSARFRAIFAFGPAAEIADYGNTLVPYLAGDPTQTRLRSPVEWLGDVRSPTWVFEGTWGSYNKGEALDAIRSAAHNPAVHVRKFPTYSHYGVLHPLQTGLAAKLAGDDGRTTFALSDWELFTAAPPLSLKGLLAVVICIALVLVILRWLFRRG